MLGTPPRRLSTRGSTPTFSPSDSPDIWGHSNDATASRPTSIPRTTVSLHRRHHGRSDHPLGGEEGGSPPDSRPSLRRLTSETERQVAESSRSGSERGSLDVLRMSAVDENGHGEDGEVEVLIHQVGQGFSSRADGQVKPVESLAGIALLYGIDLATLRKINKLWPSDPVHLRTHLYVPLEACRWNKAAETFMRGPEEGQVTLVPKATPIGLSKSKGKGKGRGKEVAQPKLIDDANGFVEDGCFDEYDAWIDEDAKPCTSPTNEVYDRKSVDTLRPDLISEDEDEPTPRVLDVVRIPNSQLRFFPKSHKPPDASRHSLEYDLRRTSIERSSAPLRRRSSAEGPSIQNNLRTLPRPLQPSKPQPTPPLPKSSKIVRLRPPSATPIPKPSPSSNSLAHRLSSLFVVPPPPSPLPLPARSAPRLSMESRSSRASSPSQAKPVQPEVVLEMHPRKSIETTRTNGGWTPVDKGRKSR